MKRIFCFIVICTTIITTVHSQNKWVDFHVSRTNFVDTIPLEFQNNLPIVSIEMNGNIKRFILDTGASVGNIFSKSIICPKDTLGRELIGDTHHKTDTLHIVTLPPFRLGNLQISNYPAVLSKQEMISLSCLDIDGLLGFNLFNKGLSVKIDIAAKRLIITDRKDFFKREKGYALKYKLSSFTPYVWIRSVKGIWEEVLLDTGANSFYILSNENYAYFARKKKKKEINVIAKTIGNRTEGLFGIAKDDEIYMLQLEELKWQDFSFKQVRTITQANGSSKIGGGILNYGLLIIDSPHNQIIFQPYNQNNFCIATDKRIHVNRLNFDITTEPVRVSLIWQESKAFQQGIRKGDILMQVDDIHVENNKCSFIRYMQKKDQFDNQMIKCLIKTKNGDEEEVLF